MIIECAQCKTEINRKPYYVKKHKGKICCSDECRKLFRNKKVEVHCNICNKKLERMPSDILASKSGLFYCNKSCAAKNNNIGIRRGKYGEKAYRKLAFDKKDHKCNRCNYNDIVKILQVHHIDKNRSNNKLDNLEILCPNCHAIEHWS